jgi:serine/threonine protein kinase
VTEREKIGKYEIVSELGRGGMGVVYKAWEESLQRFVAIKMLGDQLTHDETVVKRFLREARAVADLNHPNVVQVFAVDTHEGRPYFAMEYVEGESLTELIRTSHRVDPLRAVQLLKEAAAGLAASHAKGVVHRDIKPDNIMLTKHGGVKVVDFGVAKIDDPDSKLTATGMAVGTPNYISPEVCLGKEVDARSDLFSLGIVFFEMLAGETPFQADSPIAMMTAVVNAEVPDITSLNSEVDENIHLILSQMLEKNPANRYAGCQTLVEDLESYAAGQPPAHAVAAVNNATLKMPLPKDISAATTQAAPTLANKGKDRSRMGAVRWAVPILLLVSAGATGWYFYDEDTGQPATDSGAIDGSLAQKNSLANEPQINQSASSASTIDQQSTQQPATQTSALTTTPAVIIDTTPTQIALVERPAIDTRPDPPVQVPVNTGPPKLVVIANGDPAVSTMIESVLENTLSAADFIVLDEQFFDGLDQRGFNLSLADMGRAVQNNGADILVFADIRPAGERKLTFYGRTEFQKTATMQIRAVLVADKRSLGAPWVNSLEYVPLNAQEQARDVAQPIADELVERLQALQ